MTLQATSKRSGTLDVRASAIQSDAGTTSPDQERSHQQIRHRAYEIYLERSGFPGNELDDWLQAERELERVGCPKQSD
jgi:Protein of unknown function (DUF2934)